MTRDEEVYPNAESFKPERFIKDGALNKKIKDPRDIVFGFGRRCIFFAYCLSRLIPLFILCIRICPGRHMGFNTLWMTFAAILATLEITESDETVLPQDGRYFSPGAITL
jgi:cytochrome P450